MKWLLFNMFFSFTLLAQVPETDIWLFKLKKEDGKYTYFNPLNITNRLGYDNQPCFSRDGKKLVYTSIREDNQADIYQYTIKNKAHVNVTKSKVSEYSPVILNNEGFTSVVVEEDSTQRVWQYNSDGTFNKIFNLNTDSIGYYTLLNKDTLLYYKLSNPHSLHSLNLTNNTDVWICDHPSRAFKKIGTTNNFIYAIKDKNSLQYRIYNPVLRESKLYTSYPSLNEDFIWHSELGLIKSENSELLRYNEQSKKWEILFSFSDLGIKKITRFVFDLKSKQLAIVNNLW